ncbi:MAG: hypothetical protein HKM03_10965 [Steroidobacteraceae bacterium]|nr:hypothetical protein [Steroidobacteraceae bacterium]
MHGIRALMVTALQRLNSLRHGFALRLSEGLRATRGTYRERPCLALPPLDAAETAVIENLQTRYQTRFERDLSAPTSLRNYEYLDVLDRAFAQAGRSPPTGGALCDIGCANFWYVRALHAFFRPSSLIGVEVEGYRRYRDGHTRFDYAAGYIEGLPNTRFEVADFRDFGEPADVITAWFPFVTSTAILAWRLPLSMLRPQALFGRVKRNLRADGWFVMINHGQQEASTAAELCDAAGLEQCFCAAIAGPLGTHRPRVPVVSGWRLPRTYTGS